MVERHLLGLYSDYMAVEVDEAETTSKLIEELQFWTRDNLNINKNKTKTLTLDTGIIKASTEAGIEAVTKFKYFGVTLSATNSVMIYEAKKVCDHCTTSVAKKLAKIECASQEIRSTIYQCILVSFSCYHLAPLIVAGIISHENDIVWKNTHFKRRVNLIRSRAEETFGLISHKKETDRIHF